MSNILLVTSKLRVTVRLSSVKSKSLVLRKDALIFFHIQVSLLLNVLIQNMNAEVVYVFWIKSFKQLKFDIYGF